LFPFRLLALTMSAAALSATAPPQGDTAGALSCPPPAPLRIPPSTASGQSGAINIRAARYEAVEGQPIRFLDNVRVVQGSQQLETDEIAYDRASGRVDIPGRLRFNDARLQLDAAEAWYQTRERLAWFLDVDYAISGTTATGSAAQAEWLGPDRARLERFDFTTCPPQQRDWQLKASRVDLDLDSGVGTARHARLSFKGIPLLYSPWLSFPLDDRRKTGFLYPGFGYSTDDGIDIQVPWYWNIAPEQDATLTPRWIEKRGVQLGVQYRFLGGRQAGQVDIEWLPDDQRADRDRYFAELAYGARPWTDWQAAINFRRASDDNYFIDLGGDLNASATQFLRSSASLTGNGTSWLLSLSADTFQVLDENVRPEREPYRRVPRVQLAVNHPLGHGWSLALDGEAVYFDRSQGVTGGRVDLLTRLHYDLVAPGWYLRPRLGLRATGYALEDHTEDSLSRTLPIASLDAGLTFERRLSGGRIQTLEPRFYYLYVPFRSQADLPDFDTRELTFGFSQLFHYNRFSGPDRQGDANQLTLALTSRLLDAGDGSSLLDASIGQIIHFGDRRVQLPERPVEERSRSSVVAELTWRPARALAVSAGLQWDDDADETEVARFGLSYRGDDRRQAAFGYRLRRDRVDQADLRLHYPLGERLNIIGRVTYSFEDNEALELLGGLEYDTCCWSLRLTAREWINDRESDTRTAFFIELQLKGLGTIGRAPYPLFYDQE